MTATTLDSQLTPTTDQGLLSRIDPEVLDSALQTAGGSVVDIDLTVFVYLFIFFAVWFLLKKLLFDPYLAVRDAREAGTAGSRDEAEALEAKAEKLMSEYKEEIATAQREASSLRAELRDSSKSEQKQILEEAYEGASKVIAEGREKLESQVNSAREEMREEATSLAKLISERLLPH